MGKWEMVRLVEVASTISDGNWIESKDQSPSGIRLLQVGNIGKGYYVDKAERAKYISEATFSELKCTEVFEGDILISRLPDPIGRACIVPALSIKLITAVDCTIVRLNNQLCDKRYLLHYLCSPKYFWQIEKYVVGSTRSRISRTNLQTISIPNPPLPIQQKIADVLDRASALIEKRKAQIAKLDLLVKSRFVEMFGDPVTNPMGWEVRKLGKLTSLITKGASPNWQGYGYTQDSTQTLFVTSENVREGYMDLETPKYIEDAFKNKQRRSILKKGDFLVNIVGASIGRAAQYTLDAKANINQAVALARLKSTEVNERYLLDYLNSSKALEMYESMQVSVARANLSLQNISDLEIILPPLDLQNQFADFVRQADKSKFAMQQELDKLQTLYKSLMQKCFSGEML